MGARQNPPGTGKANSLGLLRAGMAGAVTRMSLSSQPHAEGRREQPVLTLTDKENACAVSEQSPGPRVTVTALPSPKWTGGSFLSHSALSASWHNDPC